MNPQYSNNPMKTQKKKGEGLYFQKSNNRWKWMAGATAATAAGVTASPANTITVNLLNNYISATGGNHLNADLTGDGHLDLTIANAFYYVRKGYYPSFDKYFATVDLNGVHAQAYFNNDYQYGVVLLGSRQAFVYHGYGTYSLMGSIPITFKDLHINNGALTKGSLEVTVSSAGSQFGKAAVQLDSFTYNTPDQGSSLVLLAMGAGGILALRRWRVPQGRS
jgi:hypothetical protein